MLGQSNAREVLQHRARSISEFFTFFVLTLFLTFLVSAAFYSFTASDLDIASASTNARDLLAENYEQTVTGWAYTLSPEGKTVKKRVSFTEISKDGSTSWKHDDYLLGKPVTVKDSFFGTFFRSFRTYGRALNEGRVVQLTSRWLQTGTSKPAGSFAFDRKYDAEVYVQWFNYKAAQNRIKKWQNGVVPPRRDDVKP